MPWPGCEGTTYQMRYAVVSTPRVWGYREMRCVVVLTPRVWGYLQGEIDIGAAPPAATTPAAETKKKSRRRSMF